MNIRTRFITLLCAALAANLLLVACGSDDNDSQEAQIEQPAKEHDIEAGNKQKPADEFPEDVVVPSDWFIIAKAPADDGFILSATTKDTVDVALAAVRQLFTDEGWTETGVQKPNAMMTQVSFSKDGRITNLNFINSYQARNVQLTTSKKPN